MNSLASVYLDTSLLSALHYHGGSIQGFQYHLVTQEWWQSERKYFELFCSEVAEEELRKGHYSGQDKAIAEARRLRYLPVTKDVDACAQWYLRSGVVPKNKPGDAFQLALASLYEVDYLLTWNYAHLANPAVHDRVAELNEGRGLWVPWLVSPQTIPRASMGQVIRRRR